MGKQETGKISEDHLKQPEVGRVADSLIQEFKQRIRRVPEFAQALQDQYLSDEPQKKLEDPVKFRKGEYCYQVWYTIDTEREELRVSKLPVDPDTNDGIDENIILEALINRRTRQFVGGAIKSAKFFKEEKAELFTNTDIAIQKVRKFVRNNF